MHSSTVLTAWDGDRLVGLIEGMPEDEANVPFYEKHGFRRMEHGAAIQICNYADKR